MNEPITHLVSDLLDATAGRMSDVAAEAGVSYSALYSWVTGRRRPSRRNLRRLADVAAERGGRLSELGERLRARVDAAEAEAGRGDD